jgi:hypothetical protein
MWNQQKLTEIKKQLLSARVSVQAVQVKAVLEDDEGFAECMYDLAERIGHELDRVEATITERFGF